MTDTLRQLTDQEKTALELLDNAPDAFTGMATAARETGLSHEQIREANSLRAARRRTNGGVSVVPYAEADQTLAGVSVVDVPLPDPAEGFDPASAVERMLQRADRIGSVRAKHLAAAIRRDVEDLRETLDEDEATLAARNRRDALLARRAELDEQIAEVDRMLRPATAAKTKPGTARKTARRKPAGKRRAAAGNTLPYSQAVRAWAKANWGGEVSERGRLSNEIITAYQAAQSAQVAASASADS